MMDRERACIPKLQIDFLDAIALPVYRYELKALGKLAFQVNSLSLEPKMKSLGS